MLSEKELKNKYKENHDKLTADYYKKHLMSKDEFDYYHSENWLDMEAELIAGGYSTLSEPTRNLTSEIDKLKVRLDTLERQ